MICVELNVKGNLQLKLILKLSGRFPFNFEVIPYLLEYTSPLFISVSSSILIQGCMYCELRPSSDAEPNTLN